MKIFVWDKLKDGVWKPRYVRQCTFRKALQIGHQDTSSSEHRIRRVKTQEELEKYIEDGVFIHNESKLETWKVEWVA